MSTADSIWHNTGDGPCPATLRDGAVHQLSDLLDDDAWPAASQRAEQISGLRCVLTLPVVAGTQVLGALTVAARSPHIFGPSSVAIGSILASHGALALACTAARDRTTELTEALRSNRLIGGP